eukprot:1155689-Pelagomonas_calceolata.AAC.2
MFDSLGVRAHSKDTLLLLERTGGAGCLCSMPPTNTGRVSDPGDVMAPRSRDSMQEQVPPKPH